MNGSFAFNIDITTLAVLFAALASSATWHYLVTARVHVGFENILLRQNKVFNFRRFKFLTPEISIGNRARIIDIFAISYTVIAIMIAIADLYDDNFDSFSKRDLLDRVFGFDSILLDVSVVFIAVFGANLVLALAVGLTRPSHSYEGQILYASAGAHYAAPGALIDVRKAASAEKEPRVPSITPKQYRVLLSDRRFLAKVVEEHKRLHGDPQTGDYYDQGRTDEDLLLEFLQSRRTKEGPD